MPRESFRPIPAALFRGYMDEPKQPKPKRPKRKPKKTPANKAFEAPENK